MDWNLFEGSLMSFSGRRYKET